jgi:hypothetical protein
VSVPSVVCSVAGAAGAARRLFAAGRPEARFVAPVRRELARAREDVARFAVPARFRVVARLVRERVAARFFRRVLLAIVGPPLVEWDAKSSLGTFRCARSFDGPDAFPFRAALLGEDSADVPAAAPCGRAAPCPTRTV